jgi:hypothetical protein
VSKDVLYAGRDTACYADMQTFGILVKASIALVRQRLSPPSPKRPAGSAAYKPAWFGTCLHQHSCMLANSHSLHYIKISLSNYKVKESSSHFTHSFFFKCLTPGIPLG